MNRDLSRLVSQFDRLVREHKVDTRYPIVAELKATSKELSARHKRKNAVQIGLQIIVHHNLKTELGR
jgi:hypothetical protein